MDEIVYINNGDGTFTTWGGNNINQDNYGSKNVNWIDYDNDDDFDIFICNRGDKNTLLRNNGDGTHTKISDNTLVNNPASSSSSSWGDYDNDLDLDLFVGNTSPNKLFLKKSHSIIYKHRTKIKMAGLVNINESNLSKTPP